jgi:hypothetical protein
MDPRKEAPRVLEKTVREFGQKALEPRTVRRYATWRTPKIRHYMGR